MTKIEKMLDERIRDLNAGGRIKELESWLIEIGMLYDKGNDWFVLPDTVLGVYLKVYLDYNTINIKYDWKNSDGDWNNDNDYIWHSWSIYKDDIKSEIENCIADVINNCTYVELEK